MREFRIPMYTTLGKIWGHYRAPCLWSNMCKKGRAGNPWKLGGHREWRNRAADTGRGNDCLVSLQVMWQAGTTGVLPAHFQLTSWHNWQSWRLIGEIFGRNRLKFLVLASPTMFTSSSFPCQSVVYSRNSPKLIDNFLAFLNFNRLS